MEDLVLRERQVVGVGLVTSWTLVAQVLHVVEWDLLACGLQHMEREL